MHYVIIQDSYVGVFISLELVLPYLKQGIQPYQCYYMYEVEEYLRNNLTFDDLYDYGWEEELKGIQLDVILPRRTSINN